MRLLLDQGLPRSAATELRGVGHDVAHAGDLGLATASDARILEAARDGARVVVTLDADFHHLLAVGGASKPSVVRFRIEGLRGPELARLLLRVVATCAADMEAGAAVTVDMGDEGARVRVRRLPLVPGAE